MYWVNRDTKVLYRTQKSNGDNTERLNIHMEGVSDLRLIRRTHLLKSKHSV